MQNYSMFLLLVLQLAALFPQSRFGLGKENGDIVIVRHKRGLFTDDKMKDLKRLSDEFIKKGREIICSNETPVPKLTQQSRNDTCVQFEIESNDWDADSKQCDSNYVEFLVKAGGNEEKKTMAPGIALLCTFL